MLRDLLDALRCPRPHDETWLVAMVQRAEGAELLDADLACPVCGAEFVIHEGIARFDPPVAPAPAVAIEAVRLAALLGVTEGQQPVLLAGVYADAGAALAELVPVPQLWLNARRTAPRPATLVGALEVRGRVPLGVETLAGAALDGAHSDGPMLDSVVRAVRRGGRLVAPATALLPAGVQTVAHDAHEQVADVTTRASGLVELRRRAPDQVG